MSNRKCVTSQWKQVSCALLFYFTLLFSYNTISAQDFDGDSIYYTPIPKPQAHKLKVKLTKPFRSHDTTFVNNKKPDYFFLLQTGSLIGCHDCGAGKDITSASTFVNGITLGKKGRAGAGIGFDSFIGWHALPVFASMSWDLIGNKNRNAFFIQLNYGVAKAWRQKSNQDYGFQRAEGGRMLSPQVGYRIKYHDLRLSLSVGAKMQRVFTFYEYPTWAWVNGEYQPTTTTSTIKQNMSRLLVSMAVGWK